MGNMWTGQRRRSEHPPADAVPETFVESPLAIMVRALYERERSRYDSLREGQPIEYKAPLGYKSKVETRYADDNGKGDPLTKAKDSTWEKLAELLLRKKIDPDLYMRVQFEAETLKLLNPPEPSQLLSQARFEIYEEALVGLSESVAVSLITQQEIAASEVGFIRAGGRTTEDAVAHTIIDENLELSPIFRYCLAKSMTGERFQELAQHYQMCAVLQYVCYAAAFDASWHEYLPAGFASMADKLYAMYLSKYTNT